MNNLRAYQHAGVSFLRSHRAAILADQMGLGKTVQAIVAAAGCGKRTLIVCPAFVRNVWFDEFRRWSSLVPHQLRSRSPYQLCTEEVCIIGYDVLAAWEQTLVDWRPDTVIFDEAHVMVGAKSERAKAAAHIAHSTTYRWALTGTPLTNNMRGLHTLLSILTPGTFGTWFKFGLRYCDAHQKQVAPTKMVWVYDGESHRDELRTRLQSYMLRRTLDDVALELPAKTRQCIPIDTGLAPYTPSSDEIDFRDRTRLMGGLANAFSLKRAAIEEVLRTHVEDGRVVVVFVWKREHAHIVADIACKIGACGIAVTGEYGVTQRQAIIDTARYSLSRTVIACTIDSCGVGIDLSFADVCVFAELSYEPHKLLQAEARLHRFGQTRPVLVQYMIATGTLDETVASVVVSRLNAFEGVVGAVGDNLAAEIRGDTMSQFEKRMLEFAQSGAQYDEGDE